MGYTHYWERPGTLPHPRFGEAAEDCRRFCAALDIPLGGENGNGQPTFNAEEICFNGHVDSGKLTSIQRMEGLVWPHQGAHGVAVVGEADAVVGNWNAGPAVGARVLGPNGDGSYEPFHIERVFHPLYPEQQAMLGWWSSFCKTNYRPYDLCVQGCLIVLHHHFGTRLLRVSSDGASSDWNDARDACQRVMGYGLDWGEGKLAPAPTQKRTEQQSSP